MKERNRNTIESPGGRESLRNPASKSLEVDGFWRQAGPNGVTLSAKRDNVMGASAKQLLQRVTGQPILGVEREA